MEYGRFIDQKLSNLNYSKKNFVKNKHEKIKELYLNFSKYYLDPVLMKMQNTENYSIYMIGIQCLTSIENRYLIVSTQRDMFPIKTRKNLSELKWLWFETRTTKNKENLSVYSYNPKRGTPLDETISRIEVTKYSSIYKAENSPIRIEIFNTEKMNLPYKKKGTIVSALETFQTAISIL